MRKNGVLLPISSLSSKYGIGSFSKEAYKFIDTLKSAGQSYWQILPLGPTGFGDSPYQSFSTFAGNPYFIDLEELIKSGLLTEEECESYDWGSDTENIDYEKIYLSRFKVLKIAFERSNILENEEFKSYCDENSWWLSDYALYTAIKDSNNGKSWLEWDEDIRIRKEDAILAKEKELKFEIEFCKFQQYLFSTQWSKLKEYSNKNGISIIGDIPIYVSLDSSDTWSNPKLFQLDKYGLPTNVAGCPPDSFSATGQLWGNPLYKWDYHKDTNYKWWIDRIKYSFKLHDIVRIDHFRGFDEYYSIPYGDKTAENGMWKKGPGIQLFNKIKNELGDLNIIAEDLGFLTETVKELLKDSGFPGMKIIQFAFDSREESDYMPHTYERNSVVYTGTHDNDTIVGWYNVLDSEDKNLTYDYINNYNNNVKEIHWDFIILAMRSISNTCIIPAQDFLGLGSESRINTPSTLGENWRWRIKKDAFDKELISKIKRLTKITGRI